jgi:hypothetical protein
VSERVIECEDCDGLGGGGACRTCDGVGVVTMQVEEEQSDQPALEEAGP